MHDMHDDPAQFAKMFEEIGIIHDEFFRAWRKFPLSNVFTIAELKDELKRQVQGSTGELALFMLWVELSNNTTEAIEAYKASRTGSVTRYEVIRLIAKKFYSLEPWPEPKDIFQLSPMSQGNSPRTGC